jgi:hypothetical protein
MTTTMQPLYKKMPNTDEPTERPVDRPTERPDLRLTGRPAGCIQGLCNLFIVTIHE